MTTRITWTTKQADPPLVHLQQEQSWQQYSQIELTRRCTNTYVHILPARDTTTPRRLNDDRIWHSRNLRCASCEGFCPICDAPCCIYKAAKEVLAKPKNFQTNMSRRLVKAIDRLGSHVKDTSTFSTCTLGGGCGRRVCPKCCGTCPTSICRDIQCKVFLYSNYVEWYDWVIALINRLGVQAWSLGCVRLA